MPDEIRQLTARREILEEEKKIKYETLEKEKKIKHEILKAESIKLREIENQMIVEEKAEEDEFRQLVAEMSALKFTESSQVSRYIVNRRLGSKYKHISGILQMKRKGDMWDFNGGFPPKIYARLCNALGLKNQHSKARAGKFTAYKDIEGY